MNEFWGHLDEAGNGSSNRLEELQRGFTRGNTGWADFRSYTFTFETTPTNVKVWVDGTLEIDIDGDFNFGTGRFGFFNHSQGQVTYNAFGAQGFAVLEGSSLGIEIPFVDLGLEDTHTATIDWQDGTLDPATVVQGQGTGLVQGSHVYLDDFLTEIEICVEDDDGGTGCGLFR